ncbi:unnamed protein product [Brassica napus]|uniref:(rape) hypothetical protein n=1 Tax=Brassica napus TaxID=3708 RepID=A0A816JPX2_BRANA|nr:unnamed protein product [Brassica napus]
MLIYVSADNSYVTFSPKQLQQSGVAAWREGYRSSTWTHDAAVEAREDQDNCARASAMRKFVDKMITLGKDGSLHKRRQALGIIYEKQIVHTLFAEVPDRIESEDRDGSLSFCG